jgi:putative transposase
MSTKYKFAKAEGTYFVTFTVVNWIDLFIRNEYKNILLDSWKYCCSEKGLIIYGWCIMTSHAHMLVATRKNKLEDIMRDMKKHTSYELKEAIAKHPQESRRNWMEKMFRQAGEINEHNDKHQLWIQDNHPILLQNKEQAKRCLEYIHNNPVVSGIVTKAEEYLYSSASDYYFDRKGLIEIERING